MSENEQAIEWYLARDGKQHGPISDLEMRKVVEGGHLRPTDLVWRLGFPDWVPSTTAFPSQPVPRPVPPPPNLPRPQAPQPEARAEPEFRTDPRAGYRGSQTGPGHGHPAASQSAFDAPHPGANPAADGPHLAAHGPNEAGQSGLGQTGPGPGGQPGYAQPHPAARTAQAPAGHYPQPGTPSAGPGPGPGQGTRAGPYGNGAAGDFHARGDDPWRATRPGQPAPRGPGRPADDDFDAEDGERRGFPWKTAVIAVLLAMIGGAVFALYKTNRLSLSSLPFLTSATGDEVPVVRAPKESYKESPLKSSGDTAAEIDTGFQKAPLWQLIKKEFPDWYNERVADTVRLKGERKDDNAIAQFLTKSLVDLRRQNSTSALAASSNRLRFIATSFVDNLTKLSQRSTDACYSFISQGEVSPVMVELLRASELTSGLQSQFTAIFEAVADGRKSPKNHGVPMRSDYDMLAQQLAARGWSTADLQLFSDAGALARAQPEKVCQMVQDWFQAQLAVKDEAVQMRLLVEALKPVIAG